VFLKLFVQVFTDSDVLEHSLQLGRVLEAARLLQEKKKPKRQPADSRWQFSFPAVNLTLSLEIMLASASSLALFWWTRRLASILA